MQDREMKEVIWKIRQIMKKRGLKEIKASAGYLWYHLRT
jgi:hypothetical protein